MLKWALYALVGLGGIIAITLIVGWSLPVGHRASRTSSFAAPTDRVFAAVGGFTAYPDWRSNVSRVEVSGGPGVGTLVREFGTSGEIPYRVEVLESPGRLVMRITEDEKAFGGTWTYELRPSASGGTELTITEDGEVYNPIFRVMSRFVFGHYATIDQYLEDLHKHLGA